MLIQPLEFTPDYHAPGVDSDTAWWFVFQGDRLALATDGEAYRPPEQQELDALGVRLSTSGYMGRLQQGDAVRHCYFGLIDDDCVPDDALTIVNLRSLFGRFDESLLALAGRAQQLLFWETTHRFCGRCGTPTELATEELARRCPACGLSRYANPAPAIIIAVTRAAAAGRQILLVRNHRFPPDRFSVIAGFVDPGESLEDCCRREVMEEVGVEIENVRYFASQGWPFPNSLMVGFTADYVAGDFVLEEAEIAEAGWFYANQLPSVPPRVSIARALIDDFVSSQMAEPIDLRDWSQRS